MQKRLIPMIFFTAILLAIGSYFYVKNNLVSYGIDTGSVLYKDYFLHKLFIYPDFEQLDYMQGRNFFDLMPFYFFLFIGLLSGSLSFLSKGKLYFQYLAVRTKSNRELFVKMKQHGGWLIISYSTLYHIVFYVMIAGNMYLYQESVKNFSFQAGLLFITHTIFLFALTRLLFFSFLFFSEVVYILCLASLLSLIFMINMTFPMWAILFIWSGNYWLINLSFSGMVLLISQGLSMRVPFYL